MHPSKAPNQRYTYGDYMSWPEEEQWELLDGVAYEMTTPPRIHQEFVGGIACQIGNFLHDRSESVYMRPLDIRLPEGDEPDDDVITSVQPDISVICDSSKLDDAGCRGAPDWIIEVIAPDTAIKDLETKRWIYERHGVQEYWIVHPTDRRVMVYTLGDDGKYERHAQMAGVGEVLAVGLFHELLIDWEFIKAA